MKTVVTFGELLLRLSPPGCERIAQSSSFQATFAGAEANVAVQAAELGHEAKFVSVLPENDVAETALRHLRYWGVDTERVVRAGCRMGIYFFENGFGARASSVIYDRDSSAISALSPELYDWPNLLAGADWFHTTGITAALSPNSTRATADALETARKLGIRTSFDLNFRRKLWTPERARKTVEPMLAGLDLFIANPVQIEELFGLRAETPAALADFVRREFGVKSVGFALRQTDECERHFRAAAWADSREHVTTRWFRCEVLEPLGGGDAFAGALIVAILEGQTHANALEFGVAAACLKHTIPGDFAKSSRQEIESFLRNGTVRGVSR